ncbi:MAG: ABC transporter ATP-binding protein [Lentilactobacillus diolivorans]|jgi:energy-coupling factor transport system ATP-binding protein|nr:ABC transporter ATP-binding protein [Lentilactobacillus diolivorans]RRG01335.1 MAG: ATP-binding cassette domain-containing protein [Lactobacillus sp.]
MSQSQPIISFKDFSFKYKTQQEATLKHLDLDIFPGEKVLILGPSGSGKTTLVKCINGLIPNQDKGMISGKCVINGKEINHTSIFQRGNDVGTVLQDSDAQFVGLSVGEDIAFYLENKNVPLHDMQAKVTKAAEIVGLDSFLSSLPFDLSGGQKQRTSIAGILHGNAPILLFDEPLAALNPSMSESIVDLIDQLNHQEHKTVVIVEHRFEEVLHKEIDKIVLLNEGQIVKIGKPDDFLKDDILEKYGIRNPLYLDALRKVSGNLKQDHDLWNVDLINPSDYQSDFQKFLNNRSSQPNRLTQKDAKGIIDVADLRYSYDGQHQVINMAHLHIKRGEKISIIGKNGSGKSTFAKLLTGILRPTTGDILELGKSIKHQTIQQIGQQMAYNMQDPNKMIVKDTVEDEVGLALQLRGISGSELSDRVAESLKVTDLYTMRHWPVNALSYGQKKRLTVASLLVLNPACLIMDEPTAGQDFEHYQRMMAFVDQVIEKKQMTLIVITHDMQLALEHTNRAIVIDQGAVIADDDPFKVLNDKWIVRQAGLRQTSIYRLAERIGVSGESLARASINV